MMSKIKLITMVLIASLGAFSYAASEDSNTTQSKQIKSDEERNIFDEDVMEVKNQKILELIDRTNPEKGRQLHELLENNPEEFQKEINEIGEKMRERFNEGRKKGKEPDAVTRATDKGNWQPPKGPEDDEQPPKKGGKASEGRRPARESFMEVMRKRNEEFVDWLKVNYPEQAEEFEKANEANPERAFRDLMPVMMKYRDIFETEKKNPELASLMKMDVDLLERRAEIIAAIQKAEDQKSKDKLSEELKTVVEARFDLILKKRQMRFDELKERLTQLQAEIKKQEADLDTLSAQRDTQVQKRVEELLTEDKEIKWD